MLCLLWQTLLSRGAKGPMVVLVPNTLSASKRRSRSTLARTKPPQTMTTMLSHTRAGLCPPCSQWIQYMIFHFSFWAALFWSETSVWLGIFRLLQPILTGRYQGGPSVHFLWWYSSFSHLTMHNDNTFTAPQVFLQSNSFAKFTPRAVARIMHGISSPGFPSATWSKNHFWSV